MARPIGVRPWAKKFGEEKAVVYVPQRGDVIRLSFTPHVGREQGGRRPALVISSSDYNRLVGLLIACPITNQAKGYAYEVSIPDGLNVTGVVLADAAKSCDWRGRNAEFVCEMPATILDEVLDRLYSLIER
jgi:mRNA interferase MazF